MKKNPLYLDRGLLLVSLFLIGLGIVQVYSSSFIFAIEKYDDGLFFFRRQLLFSGLAVCVMFLVAKMPWRYLEKLGVLAFVLAVFGVIATFTSLGVKVGGAHRWLQMPFGLRIEPSEILKVSLGFWLAYLATRKWDGLGNWMWGVWLVVVGGPLALLLKQPDFGSFAICTMVIMGVLFSIGIKWRWVFSSITVALGAFYVLIMSVPYRQARLVTFLDPWADPESKGFQIIQSLLSFYSGGITGTGLGEGQGKLFFLPEAHTDFTAAVMGEEIGFIGILIVLCLFGFLVLRGFQVSVRTRIFKQQIVALSVTLAFGLSCFLNFGVAMGLVPTKGLALPFISYGGSSLLASAMAMGILLNIDHHQKMQKKSFKGYKIPS